ncbi:nuclear transport factor 2 family protein [Leucobacter chromiireducens]|uniref:nuclear transport factor 2 family protein n=1 Tax=Leucobacter chromiireducens TaxID=283877 RepID=UPI000F631573|nr:nuclear transport factor 2 family protein [Leucobacter chromiireducens]
MSPENERAHDASVDAVRAAVQRYVDGCVAADPAVVRDAFTSDAVMWGYLGPDYVTMSGTDFAANVVGTAQPAGAEYAAEIHGIVVTGSVAHAVLEERQFLGANFRNEFGLILRDGAWRIASKIFTTVD